MRKTLSILAVSCFLAGCGASGGQDEATSTTAPVTSTTGATTSTEDTATTTTLAGPEGAIDVDAWAEGFCGNFEDWSTAISDASKNADKGVIAGDLESGRRAIVTLFETASLQTEALIKDTTDGGVPAIKDGDELVDDLIGKFEDFNTAIEAAKVDAEDLPTNDPEAFRAGSKAITTSFSDAATEVTKSFSELDVKYPSRQLSAALSTNCTGG